MAKGDIGGQAVLEGVMMKAPGRMAIAVRKSSGEIVVNSHPLKSIKDRLPILKLPVLRGIIAFGEALSLGVKSITDSAKLFDEEVFNEQKPSGFEKFLSEKTGKSTDDVIIMLTVGLAIVFSILLFIVLPTFVVGFLKTLGFDGVLLNVIEGIFRLMIFVGYVVAISRLKDIQRVFQYHGAEHKTIHCHENDEAVNVANAKKYSTLHPRCGTAFLLVVMVISIAAFSMFEWGNVFMRVLVRLMFLPIIAGISYELIRWAGRSESPILKIVMFPGLMLQKLTTREPDDLQLEVAVRAFLAVSTQEAFNEQGVVACNTCQGEKDAREGKVKPAAAGG